MAVTLRFWEAKSLGPESHVSNNPLTACLRLLALKNDMQKINRFSTGFSGRLAQLKPRATASQLLFLSQRAFVPAY